MCAEQFIRKRVVCIPCMAAAAVSDSLLCVFPSNASTPVRCVAICSGPLSRDCGIWRRIFFANHSNSNSSVQYTGEK